jgi:hypothetical protein
MSCGELIKMAKLIIINTILLWLRHNNKSNEKEEAVS